MIIPIVTLDKTYINQELDNVYFLDSTRINGTNEIVSRRGESIDEQIKRMAKEVGTKKIFLADDVVFSGNVLRNIIKRFDNEGIKVLGIISAISTSEAYEYFNRRLKYGIIANYIMDDKVIDQICERDFYFGIAGSGIMIDTPEGLFKAPYFRPYGNPNERASIPVACENYFSRGCIDRSIYLWEEIDKLRRLKTKIAELPERIINTKQEDLVVKTLKKEMK